VWPKLIPAEAGISLFTISNLSFSRRREPPHLLFNLSSANYRFQRRLESPYLLFPTCHSREGENLLINKTLIVILAEAGTPKR
jgi:hypothetical protein